MNTRDASNVEKSMIMDVFNLVEQIKVQEEAKGKKSKDESQDAKKKQ